MPAAVRRRPSWPGRVAAVAALLGIAACTTPQIDGQWSDPAFAGRTLRETTVLVYCRAPDSTLARLCEDRLISNLGEGGVRALRPDPLPDPGAPPAVLIDGARIAGATSVLTATMAIAAVTQIGAGPTIGFGFGNYSGNVGIGGGFAIPLGGVRTLPVLASNTVLVDVASGREVWSARATSPSADELPVQIAWLARASTEAMRRGELFAPR